MTLYFKSEKKPKNQRKSKKEIKREEIKRG